MNATESLTKRWERRFGACAPIGAELRKVFSPLWVRFHSLPDSGPRAKSEADVATSLARYSAVLDALVGDAPDVWVITAGYSDSAIPERTYAALAKLDPAAVPWRSVTLSADEYEHNFWHFFASHRSIASGQLNELLREVIGDRLANMLIVAEDVSWVFYPYEAGVDVIAESVAARDSIAQRFAEWVPRNLEGL